MARMLRKNNGFNYSVVVTGINKLINDLKASIDRVRNILPSYHIEDIMTKEEFVSQCMAKNGSYIDFPFGDELLVVKVRGRIFAQSFILKGVETVTLNCTREGGEFYRMAFDGIVTRGYHCPLVQQPYFNTFALADLTDDVINDMISHSYETVKSKLPKYVQRELNGDKL